jgi:hypothetical protein
MEFGVIGGRLGARRVGGLGGCCDPGASAGYEPAALSLQAGFEPACYSQVLSRDRRASSRPDSGARPS